MPVIPEAEVGGQGRGGTASLGHVARPCVKKPKMSKRSREVGGWGWVIGIQALIKVWDD